MGAQRIVVHPGAIGQGNTREEGLSRAEALLLRVIEELLPQYPGIKLCLETMGKINQLGTLEEILHLCKMDAAFIPTIDFGHLHSRGIGSIKGYEEYREVLDRIDHELGAEVVRGLHVHFSPIEFSKGGEVRHRTMAEAEYGPCFEDLAKIIAADNLKPVIISESAGTQTEDALAMQACYRKYAALGGETHEV
jgi:deoxyribonuclease-4